MSLIIATKLHQSNLASLSLLESQLENVQSKLEISKTYKRVLKKKQELMEKNSQLTNQLIELQLLHGELHVSLADDSPPKPIVFPLKIACEASQSESEPSPKLDKLDSVQKPKQLIMGAKIGAQETMGAQKGAGKVKVASKPPPEDIPDISKIDFRVGKVLEISKHPNADTLYIESIDCGDGDGRVRQVISGLVGKIAMQDIQDRILIVCCNLKTREMRGVLSEAMVICACDKDEKKTIEFIDPPPGCVPGEPILFGGYPHKPDKQLNYKEKILEKVFPELNTDESGVANYKGAAFRVGDKGICRAKTLRNTIIK